MRPAAVLMLGLFLAGCRANPDLFVTLAANAPLPTIAQLHLSATLDGKRQLRDIKHGDGRPVGVGETFEVPLLPSGIRGTLALLVEAVDAGDNVVAAGSALVTVDGDRQIPLRLTLATWQDITPSWLQSGYTFGLNVWGSGPADIYVVGGGSSQALLAHSRDGGGTWSEESLACAPGMVCPTTLTGVWGTGPGDVYATGYSDAIAHSRGDGTWTLLQVGPSAATQPVLVNAWGPGAGGGVFVVGAHGTVEHSSDGMHFMAMAPLVSVDLQSIWGSGQALFAVGDADTVVRSDNGGASFGVTQTVTPATSALKNVWGRGRDDVYVVGCRGTNGASGDCAGDGVIQHFDGTSWSMLPTLPGNNGLYGNWGSAAGALYAVGQACTILHSIDGGQTWRSQSCAQKDVVLSAVWGATTSDGNGEVVYAVGNTAPAAVPVLLRLQ
jgi:hypothetical protein